MHVVEIPVGGTSGVDGVAQLVGGRHAIEVELDRSWRGRGDGQQEIVRVGAPRADQERRGAPEMGERGAARRRSAW